MGGANLGCGGRKFKRGRKIQKSEKWKQRKKARKKPIIIIKISLIIWIFLI